MPALRCFPLALLAAMALGGLAADSLGQALPDAWQPTLVGDADSSDGPIVLLIHGMSSHPNAERIDRFAKSLQRVSPDLSVIRLDWSKAAVPDRIGFFPDPRSVARRIDAVGKAAAGHLRALGVTGDRLTIVGESFGAYIGCRLAEALGGVQRLVALNPAHRAGGYPPPALSTVAQSSVSISTPSVFDSAESIADAQLRLSFPAETSPLAMHTAGFRWLAGQIDGGDLSLVEPSNEPPRAGLTLAVNTAALDQARSALD